jgi:uncharacterized protein (DUF3084 family)
MTLKHPLLWVLGGLAVVAVPALAQTTGGDTLAALLLEVRQLRIAVERAATTSPQIQLLTARLTVQNERVSRAAGDHDATRQELEQISAATAQMTAQLEQLEGTRRTEQDQQRQREIAEQEASIRQELANLSTREGRLRLREAELANLMAAEQAQWMELNRRLDDLERALTAR